MQKNKKQSKEKIKSQELLKNKEKFMNLKGYKIKVGEDTFILFEKEDIVWRVGGKSCVICQIYIYVNLLYYLSMIVLFINL